MKLFPQNVEDPSNKTNKKKLFDNFPILIIYI